VLVHCVLCWSRIRLTLWRLMRRRPFPLPPSHVPCLFSAWRTSKPQHAGLDSKNVPIVVIHAFVAICRRTASITIVIIAVLFADCLCSIWARCSPAAVPFGAGARITITLVNKPISRPSICPVNFSLSADANALSKQRQNILTTATSKNDRHACTDLEAIGGRQHARLIPLVHSSPHTSHPRRGGEALRLEVGKIV
jgi:hypothetical protein